MGAHAQLIGPIVIGDNAKIGAGAIVTVDVKNDTTAVGFVTKGTQSGCQ